MTSLIHFALETGGALLREDGKYMLLETSVPPTVPVAPTIGTLTAGVGSVSAAFTPGGSGGSPILDYTATTTPGGFHTTGPSSPLIISGLSNIPYTVKVTARNAIGNSLPSAASNSATPTGGGGSNVSLYSNGTLSSLFPASPVLSFGCTLNYNYNANPANVCPGSTHSLEVATNTAFGGGFQPGSLWTTIPPNGFDDRTFVALRFSLKTPTPSSMYVSSHYSRSTGNDLPGSTSATQGSTCLNIPANTWTTVTVPLANLALLGAANAYKFAIGSNANSIVYYLDNITWIAGVFAWAFQGTGVPAAGWTDASVSAVADYTWLPQTLNPGTNGLYSLNNPAAPASQFTASASGTSLTVSSITSGTINIGDTVCWQTSSPVGTILSGSFPNYVLSASAGTLTSRVWASAPAQSLMTGVKLTAGVVSGAWKLTHAGFTVTPYANFVFGVIPTKSGYGYSVRFFNTSGSPVGNAVVTSSLTTQHDFGISTGAFTVHSIPLSSFGSIGSVIGGWSITETSGNTTNVTYFSAAGFTS